MSGGHLRLARGQTARAAEPRTVPAGPAARSLDTSSLLPLAALIGGAAALAIGGVFVRLSELPPTASAAYRVAIVIPILLMIEWRQRRAAPVQESVTWTTGKGTLILIGFIFSGNLALYQWSVHYTTLANSNLLANLAPIFVVLGAWLLFGQRITIGFALGMALALFGAVVLISERAELGWTQLLGGLLGLATAVFYGAYLLAVSRVRARFSTVSVMAWTSIGSFVVLFPLSAALGEQLVPRTLHGVEVLVALALISHLSGQGMIAYALAKLPAGLSSLTLLIQPVFATVLGWFLFHERMGVTELIGGIVILVGIGIARQNS